MQPATNPIKNRYKIRKLEQFGNQNADSQDEAEGDRHFEYCKF